MPVKECRKVKATKQEKRRHITMQIESAKTTHSWIDATLTGESQKYLPTPDLLVFRTYPFNHVRIRMWSCVRMLDNLQCHCDCITILLACPLLTFFFLLQIKYETQYAFNVPSCSDSTFSIWK